MRVVQVRQTAARLMLTVVAVVLVVSERTGQMVERVMVVLA